nr:NUDIX domain-containing protein [Chloroflexota bacterium]
MRVQVLEQHREYDGFFKLERVVLRFERFDGRMSEPIQRIVFERGDSAAVLLYDKERDVVVLVEQFRYPAYMREMPEGCLLEIVAGTIDHGRSPEDVARSELLEEAGYALKELEYITTFYPSPGACSERIHLYIGYITSGAQVGTGGGVGAGEDIRVHVLPLDQALDLVDRGIIRDAKTIIALQHLALHRDRK